VVENNNTSRRRRRVCAQGNDSACAYPKRSIEKFVAQIQLINGTDMMYCCFIVHHVSCVRVMCVCTHTHARGFFRASSLSLSPTRERLLRMAATVSLSHARARARVRVCHHHLQGAHTHTHTESGVESMHSNSACKSMCIHTRARACVCSTVQYCITVQGGGAYQMS